VILSPTQLGGGLAASWGQPPLNMQQTTGHQHWMPENNSREGPEQGHLKSLESRARASRKPANFKHFY